MLHRRPATPEPVLITNAPPSPLQEFSDRRRQYTVVMSVRVVCFILAVVVTLTWLRVVFIIGALILPWVAVIAANQAKTRSSRSPFLFVPRPRRALPSGDDESHRADRTS